MPQISLKTLMSNSAPNYPAAFVEPFRAELNNVGFKELFTPADVDAAFAVQDNAIKLFVLNSVCGCAAGSARPGVVLSMLNEKVPDEYFSIFAGMEKEATDHFRMKYLPGITASSPNIALFKNSQLIYILERRQVEGKSATDIAGELNGIYNRICKTRSLEAGTELRNYISNRYQG